MRLQYVLITAARNEESYIEKLIDSTIKQSHKPLQWIIVSDGSTDGTDAIIETYAALYPWIDLIRMPEHRDRHFAAKVACFNAGYQKLNSYQYDIIGNCDADISFDSTYFEFLIDKFNEDELLGVAGTPFVEENYVSLGGPFANMEHVSGACQLFRKKCFEDIGGYVPIRGGGIDWAAVTTARMKGWKTQTFSDKSFFHHRKMGTGNSGFLQSRFNHGKKDYYLGGHPLWEIFRGAYQMTKRPYIIAGACMLAGYFSSMIQRVERPISSELMLFHRREQMQRLRGIIFKKSNIAAKL